MFSIYNTLPQKTKYIIDIGASFCVPTDPCYPFITNNDFSGLCIEGNPVNIPELKRKISKNFDVHNGYITPDNIIEIFETYNVPIQFDLLKIDIDGYDLAVLREILTIYKPSIIIAEINEKIPPPIIFEVLYKSDYQWDNSHFYGFSISAGDLVMKKNGYFIEQVYELNNIVALNQDIFPDLAQRDIQTIYEEGYVNKIGKVAHLPWNKGSQFLRKSGALPWNQNVDYWLAMNNHVGLKNTIEKYFSLSLKKIKDVDFFIDV